MLKQERPSKALIFLLSGIFVLWLVIHYWDTALGILYIGVRAAKPLILGLIIAYIVNIVMASLENRLLNKCSQPWMQKLRRPLSLLLSFVCVIGGIAALITIIFPKLWECLELLVNQAPKAVNKWILFGEKWFNTDYLEVPKVRETLESAANWILSYGKSALNGVVSGIGSVLSSLVTLLISMIFSIYLLLGKETLMSQAKRVMHMYLPEKIVEKFSYVAGIADNSFHRYIVGQFTEAIVLGSLCTIGMFLLRLPYAAMIGCVVGVTALIPFVGAYIGAAVGVIMIFTVSPIEALGFLIYLVILQQLENNLIYPRVVGSSIGLPGIWVLAAITIGGGFGGVMGMMLSVPLMATVYQLVKLDMQERKRIQMDTGNSHEREGEKE